MEVVTEIKVQTQLLTTSEAAQHLNIAESTLRWWRSQRRGPPFVKSRRIVRYRLKDLTDWEQAHYVQTRQDTCR